jgi:hypothetical protein
VLTTEVSLDTVTGLQLQEKGWEKGVVGEGGAGTLSGNWKGYLTPFSPPPQDSRPGGSLLSFL